MIVTVAFLLALVPATARAATQARDDPSDAPAGAFGEADIRQVVWDVGGGTASLTVAVDESTYGVGQRAEIGVHVLLDTDTDGIADHEIFAGRDANGTSVDLALRSLDRTQSTADCQDLAGQATAAQGTVATTIAGGRETFTFSFDPAVVPGGLSTFRWAAFGQAPPDGAQSGPWDVMPDAADPDPGAANPGDRRCGPSHSGLRVRMSEAITFPDAGPVGPLDNDMDGIPDTSDNCPSVQNAGQANNDGDPEGDACDPDDDNDTIVDSSDNCTTVANANQANTDGDAQGDTCDGDDDGDGVLDAGDTCSLLVAGAANGCPDIHRTLTLFFKAAEKLHGALRPGGPCAATRKVKLFLVKPGPDKKIVRATTRPSGKFTLVHDAKAGTYYASAATETIADVGNCLVVKSKKIVVR